jgi:hypothetical protein
MNVQSISRLLRRLGSERGQAVSEYALVAFWTVLIVLAAWQALQLALLDSYQDLASLICLPIP